jgi:hypothetical protein
MALSLMKVLNIIIGVFCIFAVYCGFSSCSDNTKHNVVQEGNKTTVHSFEIDSLSELINLANFNPVKVEFEYVAIDNSGQNDRIPLPGPSDYLLQAVLHFDSLGMKEVIRAYNSNSIRKPNYPRSDFSFEWLNKDDRLELNSLADSVLGSPAWMFGSRHLNHGGYIITKSKVFLKFWTT